MVGQKLTSLVLGHAFPNMVSGAERALCAMVDRAPKGVRITMIVPGSGPLSEFYRTKGYSMEVVPLGFPRRLFPWRHPMQSRSVSRMLAKHYQPDIIVSNTFAASYKYHRIARRLAVPHVIY